MGRRFTSRGSSGLCRVEREHGLHVTQTTRAGCLDQVDSLQGTHDVNQDILVDATAENKNEGVFWGALQAFSGNLKAIPKTLKVIRRTFRTIKVAPQS